MQRWLAETSRCCFFSCMKPKKNIFRPELIFSKTLQSDKKDGVRNTPQLNITSSVLLEIDCTRIVILDVTDFQNIQKNETLRVGTSIAGYIPKQISINRTCENVLLIFD